MRAETEFPYAGFRRYQVAHTSRTAVIVGIIALLQMVAQAQRGKTGELVLDKKGNSFKGKIVAASVAGNLANTVSNE